jgi:SRSO17 transposase
MFAEHPSAIRQASAQVENNTSGKRVQQATHAEQIESTSEPVAPAARYQTQYRSLRDGHNKPGSLFDPHAPPTNID